MSIANILRRTPLTLSSGMNSIQINQTFKIAKRLSSAIRGSAVYERLKPGPLKRLYKYYTPTAVNLAGGVPMDSIFPIEKVNVTLTGSSASFEINRPTDLMLNYHRGDGIPKLRDWIQSHVEEMHGKANPNGATCVTIGSTDAFAKIMMLLDGDTVMFDQYAYGAAVSSATALGRKGVGVQMDEHGMIPSDLRTQTLAARAKGLKPDIVYLVPVAQNPTATTMSEERKKEIYDLCRELDLIIVEDDAYYYIHFGTDKDVPGIKNLPRSLYSMDVDGRVLRLDSLSKFIAPGMRLGWVAGPSDFVAKYLLLQEMTSQFPAGLTQSVFVGLVEKWGKDGLDAHVQEMQLHYRRQCQAMVSALEGQFGANLDIVEYRAPTGGMFFWMRLIHERFRGIPSDELFKQLAAIGVITVPGQDFYVPPAVGSTLDQSSQFPVIRLSYAAPTIANIQEGIARLAKGIKSIV